VPIGLTGGQMTGILVVAGLFIAFALASSFLFPRTRPDFPGQGAMPLFVLATIVLFAAMMTAMAVLAKEKEEEGHAEPAATTTAGTTETGAATETQPAGDAQAGAEVFASAGCGGCHTLEAAGTSGAVGPNLDDAKPPLELVVDRVTNGRGVMPSFKDQLSEEQIRNVAAYVVASTK
jgi:mono/diheme cytochrome c family protein